MDCLWFCHSKKVVIPGTEGMKEYKDYLFHIKGSLKGMLLGLPVCALAVTSSIRFSALIARASLIPSILHIRLQYPLWGHFQDRNIPQ